MPRKWPWIEAVERFEVEARRILAERGVSEDSLQPSDRLESCALVILNAAKRLRKMREAGRIDAALDALLTICAEAEEMGWLADVPELENRPTIDAEINRYMRRGAKMIKGNRANGQEQALDWDAIHDADKALRRRRSDMKSKRSRAERLERDGYGDAETIRKKLPTIR